MNVKTGSPKSPNNYSTRQEFSCNMYSEEDLETIKHILMKKLEIEDVKAVENEFRTYSKALVQMLRIGYKFSLDEYFLIIRQVANPSRSSYIYNIIQYLFTCERETISKLQFPEFYDFLFSLLYNLNGFTHDFLINIITLFWDHTDNLLKHEVNGHDFLKIIFVLNAENFNKDLMIFSTNILIRLMQYADLKERYTEIYEFYYSYLTSNLDNFEKYYSTKSKSENGYSTGFVSKILELFIYLTEVDFEFPNDFVKLISDFTSLDEYFDHRVYSSLCLLFVRLDSMGYKDIIEQETANKVAKFLEKVKYQQNDNSVRRIYSDYFGLVMRRIEGILESLLEYSYFEKIIDKFHDYKTARKVANLPFLISCFHPNQFFHCSEVINKKEILPLLLDNIDLDGDLKGSLRKMFITLFKDAYNNKYTDKLAMFSDHLDQIAEIYEEDKDIMKWISKCFK